MAKTSNQSQRSKGLTYWELGNDTLNLISIGAKAVSCRGNLCHRLLLILFVVLNITVSTSAVVNHLDKLDNLSLPCF